VLSIHCPSCNSIDITFRQKTRELFCGSCGYWWIEIYYPGIAPSKDKHAIKNEIPPVGTTGRKQKGKGSSLKDNSCNSCSISKERKRFKIFLSYGHDEYVIYARKIKFLLEKRGHEVWFDIERIKAGKDWEQYIEDGLKDCDKVVLLMTPHSIRREKLGKARSSGGFCLNEIAKALEQQRPIIPVLLATLSDGIPTSICRIQYLDLRDAIPIGTNEEKFYALFDRLVEAIEHDKIDFEGGQARLIRYLKPIDFNADISPHITHFFGRKWILDLIKKWLNDEPHSKFLTLYGGPGIGKTAIAAYLSHWSNVYAFHLCIHGHADKGDPRRAILSIAYQLAQHIPEYESIIQKTDLETKVLDNAKTLCDVLLVQPLSHLANTPKQDILILIDGIDEATYDGVNEIAELLLDLYEKTPRWIRFLITSRPEGDIVSLLGFSSSCIIREDGAENLKDLKEYLQFYLDQRKIKYTENEINVILAKSEGIFLYIIWILREIDEKTLDISAPDSFPQGLSGVYRDFFKRKFPRITEYKKKIKPILECICAQQAPIPLGMIDIALQISSFERDQRLIQIGSLFPIKSESGCQRLLYTISPFHKTVINWLCGTDDKTGYPIANTYAIDIHQGHVRMAYGCKKVLSHPGIELVEYSSLHYPIHLLYSNNTRELGKVLQDISYIGRVWEKNSYAIRRCLIFLEKNQDPNYIQKLFSNICSSPDSFSKENIILCINILSLLSFYDETIMLLKSLIRRYYQDYDNPQVVPLLNALQELFIKKGKYNEFFLFLRESGIHISYLSNPYNYSQYLSIKAVQYGYQFQIKRSYLCYCEQYIIGDELKDESLKQISRINQGPWLYYLGGIENYLRLLKLYAEREEKARRNLTKDDLADCLNVIGLILYHLDYYDVSLQVLNEAEIVSTEVGNRYSHQFILGNKALVLEELGDYNQALRLLGEQEKICSEIGINDSYQRCLSQQADIYFSTGNLKLSLEKTESQESACRELNNYLFLKISLERKRKILSSMGESGVISDLDKKISEITSIIEDQKKISTSAETGELREDRLPLVTIGFEEGIDSNIVTVIFSTIRDFILSLSILDITEGDIVSVFYSPPVLQEQSEEWKTGFYPVMNSMKNGIITILVTHADLWDEDPSPRSLFSASIAFHTAVFSLKRFEYADKKKIRENMEKMAYKVFSMATGIETCSDQGCFLSYHRSLEDFDKNSSLCALCREKIIKKLTFFADSRILAESSSCLWDTERNPDSGNENAEEDTVPMSSFSTLSTGKFFFKGSYKYQQYDVVYRICQKIEALSKKGTVQERLDLCSRALDLVPTYGSLYLKRAIIALNCSDYHQYLNQIVTDCSHAITFIPRSKNAFLTRGKAYARLGKIEESECDYQFALKIDPGDIIVALNLMEILICNGQYPKAISLYTSHVSNISGKVNQLIAESLLLISYALSGIDPPPEGTRYLSDMSIIIDDISVWCTLEIDRYLRTLENNNFSKIRLQNAMMVQNKFKTHIAEN